MTTLTPTAQAGVFASQITNQLNQLAAIANGVVAGTGLPGRPAIGNNPGAPAVDGPTLATALGPETVALLTTIAAAAAQPDGAKQTAAQNELK